MPAFNHPEAGTMTVVQATGITVVASSNAQIIGVGFCGSTSGSVQFFAGTTGSASITPLIRANNAATVTAPAYVFQRVPGMVSGAGFFVNVPANTDPNLIIYWLPVGGP